MVTISLKSNTTSVGNALERQLCEERHAAHDPVAGVLSRGQAHEEDVVGGVSGGGEHAAPVARLVQRAVVEHVLRYVLALQRYQPHLGNTEDNYYCYSDKVYFNLDIIAFARETIRVK